MQRGVILFFGSIALFAASQAFAQVPHVTAEQVKEWSGSKQKMAVIDVRSREEYVEAHIPGSINIPAEHMSRDKARLPKDKTTRLIFYCRGVG